VAAVVLDQGKDMSKPIQPSWSEPGKWRLMRDDSGHDYIIPAEKAKEFQKWVEANDSFNDADEDKAERYVAEGGEEFDMYRCGSHPSCYVLVGVIEQDLGA
jgi:hypothetical protein